MACPDSRTFAAGPQGDPARQITAHPDKAGRFRPFPGTGTGHARPEKAGSGRTTTADQQCSETGGSRQAGESVRTGPDHLPEPPPGCRCRRDHSGEIPQLPAGITGHQPRAEPVCAGGQRLKRASLTVVPAGHGRFWQRHRAGCRTESVYTPTKRSLAYAEPPVATLETGHHRRLWLLHQPRRQGRCKRVRADETGGRPAGLPDATTLISPCRNKKARFLKRSLAFFDSASVTGEIGRAHV